jgi:hypothetical protein
MKYLLQYNMSSTKQTGTIAHLGQQMRLGIHFLNPNQSWYTIQSFRVFIGPIGTNYLSFDEATG